MASPDLTRKGEKEGKSGGVRLDPLPSHRNDVVKIQHQIQRFMRRSSRSHHNLHSIDSRLHLGTSTPHPRLTSQVLFPPKSPVTSPISLKSDLGSQGRVWPQTPDKFNSPYVEEQKQGEEELVKKQTSIVEVLTQMSSLTKQSSSVKIDEEFSCTDSVSKYHEFKFRLLSDDPLLKVPPSLGRQRFPPTLEGGRDTGPRRYGTSLKSL